MAVWGVSTKRGWRALAASAALILALAISACGGSGESDEEQIESSIAAALTATGSEACGESRTIAFMEETSAATGAEAEAACEETANSRENLPSSVTVSKVEVGDDGATAEVAMRGGSPDGLVLKVALVEEDGTWKVDEFVEVVRLDREAFTVRIEEEFRKEGLGTPEVRCLIAKIDGFSRSAFEQLVLAEDGAAIDRIVEQCGTLLGLEREPEPGLEPGAEPEPEPATGSERELEGALDELEEGVPAEYPRAVQQNFLTSCLETSGADFATCECALAGLESNYSVREVEEAEANIASGRMREMIETVFGLCL